MVCILVHLNTYAVADCGAKDSQAKSAHKSRPSREIEGLKYLWTVKFVNVW
jgi:hypothetical protein